MTDPDPTLERARSPPGAFEAGDQLTTDVERQQTQQPEIDQQAHDEDELQPPPPPPFFQPLFTLVTDSTTRATHHPRVHYIFSDDEPQVLTEALAQYGRQQQQNSMPLPSGSTANRPSPNERAVVLELVPKADANPDDPTPKTDGHDYEVSWASSLSADWAVVSATISPIASNSAATTTPGGAEPADDGSAQRLMLRIEGLDLESTTATATSTRPQKSSTAAKKPSLEERDLRMSAGSSSGGATPQGGKAGEEYGVIVDEFDRRMGMLRRVVDAGLERQHKVAFAVAEDSGGAHQVEQGQEQEQQQLGSEVAGQPPERQPPESRMASEGGGGGTGSAE